LNLVSYSDVFESHLLVSFQAKITRPTIG
jgi:hypothetical protein